ncbi:MAG TPA: DUF3175 domain-containing protein [Azonexus sp.]|nr:DUF3175 domain-containing protein [Azonexus sp.]
MPPESRQMKNASRPSRRWSAQVAASSDALDLERGIFAHRDPRRIALSLKKSAEASRRRKASPFQSAMSMLNFFINRAGRKLPDSRRQVLEQAKDELRALFERPRHGTGKKTG